MKTNRLEQLRKSKLESGQSLVELSLGMVVLLMILMGLFDFGRLYFIYLALEDSAGEAALYLSINPTCGAAEDGANCADPNNATYRARHAVDGLLDWTNVRILVDTPSPLGVGEIVSIRMEYDYNLLTPVLPQISQLTLTSTANQIVISE